MKKIFTILAFAALILTSCQSQEQKDLETLNNMRKEFWKENKNPDLNKAALLDSAYKNYVDQYPGDTNIPEFLYENANLHLGLMNNITEGIVILEQLFIKYPNHRRAPEAMYQTAFLLDDKLQQYDNARNRYQAFIDKYPTHTLAKDAAISLKFVGKDPAEMLKAITDSAKTHNDTLAAKP